MGYNGDMKTSILQLYIDSLKKAFRLSMERWQNLGLMMALVVVCEVLASMILTAEIRSSFVWYILIYFLVASLVSGCLALVADAAQPAGRELKARLSSFWPILYTSARCVMNGMCIVLLLSYLTVGSFGTGAVYGCLFMGFMMFNAVPEVVGLHPDLFFPVLRYSLGFMQNCWPEWILGNLPVFLPVGAFYYWQTTLADLTEFQSILSICALAAFLFFALMLRRCYFQALERKVLTEEKAILDQLKKNQR